MLLALPFETSCFVIGRVTPRCELMRCPFRARFTQCHEWTQKRLRKAVSTTCRPYQGCTPAYKAADPLPNSADTPIGFTFTLVVSERLGRAPRATRHQPTPRRPFGCARVSARYRVRGALFQAPPNRRTQARPGCYIGRWEKCVHERTDFEGNMVYFECTIVERIQNSMNVKNTQMRKMR